MSSPLSHRARPTLLRLTLLGAAWLVSFALPRRDVVVHVTSAGIANGSDATATGDDDAPPRIVSSWHAAAVRTLASDHYSFRAAVRRTGSGPRSDSCADRELLIVNGYDHAPQYLARIAFRGAGASCVPETEPFAWSPRALHYSDVAVADFDRDGHDEIVVSAFAEVGGRMDTGGVYVVAGHDPWRVDPPTLSLDDDDGFAPSSVVVGDVDGDGLLDVMVGSFWRGPRGAGRDVKHLRGDELDGPTLMFRGLETRPLTFAPPRTLGPRGVIDVHLADVDRDGALDLIAAGRVVTIAYGPDFVDAQDLPLDEGGGFVVAPSVDVAWSADRPEALIAVAASCFSVDECARDRGAHGLALWAVSRDRGEPRRLGFWPSGGVPSAVRFTNLSGSRASDMIVGVLTEGTGAPAQAVIGRPYLGALGLVGGAPLVLAADVIDEVAESGVDSSGRALDELRIRTPSVALPMATSIVPWGDPRAAHVVHEARRATRVLTYAGRGEIVGAAVHTRAGRVVPVHHVPGDAHVSLATPRDASLEGAEVVVSWRVVERPNLIITSACPVAGAAAGTLFIAPPEPARGSRDARWSQSERRHVWPGATKTIDSR